MVEHEKPIKTTDADRRQFLELAAKLGLAVPPVVTLTLTSPSYAASSGFRGGSSSAGSFVGGSSAGSSFVGSSSSTGSSGGGSSSAGILFHPERPGDRHQ